MPPRVPSSARAVIVGGGVIGTSVAYHLAKLGWRNVVLLEQGSLTCGTTWHAAGLVGQLRATAAETRCSVYGSELYARLEAETGVATGWRQCGSVSLARCDARMVQLQRQAAKAGSYGIGAEVLTAEQCGALIGPQASMEKVVGGLSLPGDGVAEPDGVTKSLARGAALAGATIVEGVKVLGFGKHQGESAVKTVLTDAGEIETDFVVNCAGMWAREVGLMAGVHVPLHAAEHWYLTTTGGAVDVDMPIVRDPDAAAYYRSVGDALMVGGFEHGAFPCFTEGCRVPGPIPDGFEFSLFDFDWEHVEGTGVLERAAEVWPALNGKVSPHTLVNGPESFTPDNRYILGEAPNVDRFYVLAGMNSSGIASAGGAGKALSEWMDAGMSQTDLWAADICRFSPRHNHLKYLRDRSVEALGLHYQLGWPDREFESARPMRRSALAPLLSDGKHPKFGEKFLWERPIFFGDSPSDLETQPSWGQPSYFDFVRREALHTRAAGKATIFDMSSFGKIKVHGASALAMLQHVCAGNVDVPADSRAVYTPMLNDRGGFEADLTVVRTGDEEFMCVTGTAQTVKDMAWMRRNAPEGCDDLRIEDVSANFSVLAVMGPASRDILSSISSCDLSSEAFPFGSSRMIDLGYSTVRATRISYVGELGWELYATTDTAASVYTAIMAAGEGQVSDGGYYAIDSLRVEASNRAFGSDLTSDVTPLEAGMAFTVDWDGSAMGVAALREARKSGVRQRLVNFTLDDSEAYLWGGEAIRRDGEAVGFVTSAVYGHTVGAACGIALVSDGKLRKLKVTKAWLADGAWTIDAGNAMHTCVASIAPLTSRDAMLS